MGLSICSVVVLQMGGGRFNSIILLSQACVPMGKAPNPKLPTEFCIGVSMCE